MDYFGFNFNRLNLYNYNFFSLKCEPRLMKLLLSCGVEVDQLGWAELGMKSVTPLELAIHLRVRDDDPARNEVLEILIEALIKLEAGKLNQISALGK